MPLTTEKRESAAVAAKTSRTWLWSLLTIAGALVLLAGSVLAYVLNVNKNIYPNVYTDGIKLGGLSIEQADRILSDHVRNKQKDFSVLVITDEFETRVSAADIGIEYGTGYTAQNAHNIGRDGNIFKRISEIYNAYFSRVDVPLSQEIIDIGTLNNAVKEIAERYNIPVIQYDYTINEKNIIIRNAKTGRYIDEEALVKALINSFEILHDNEPFAPPIETVPDAFDVDALYSRVFKEPKDAYLDVESQRDAKIMAHQVGVRFDADKLRRDLDTDVPEIIVPLIFTQPDITQQLLQENLFKDQLSSFTTYLTASNAPRTSNIRLAANFINGIILAPGDEFSFNETVGQRTSSRGFQEAGAYVNGRLVPELGGGICQMSTTAYNAALFANLKINERSNHSMTVAYVPLGQDAMVNWGTSDLKIENDKNYPIQILAVQSGGSVKVTIMGTKENDNKVTIASNTLSTTNFSRVERINPELPAGTSKTVQDGHTGHVVDTYRVIKDAEGNLISREFEAKSRYKMTDLIIEHGPGVTVTPEPEPTPTPTPTPSTAPEGDASPTPEPSPTPVPEVTPTPTPTPVPEAAPEVTPEPTPHPLPIS